MNIQSPVAEQKLLLEQLNWAVYVLSLQPQDLREHFDRCAHAIVDALSQPTYSVSLTLPNGIVMDESGKCLAPRQRIVVRVGNFINHIRELPCNAAIVTTLNNLMVDTDAATVNITRLVSYLAAERLLEARLPDSKPLLADYKAFELHKRNLLLSEAQADNIVYKLSNLVEILNLIENLYRGWTASDTYNEYYSLIISHLTEQGRALASYYTDQMINEVMEKARAGSIARGLTLFVPYLDERLYQMAKYKLVVMPVGRIPFRPEFIVSACRVAQRDVRHNQQFSQPTRWQLISALDRIIAAFDHLSGIEAPIDIVVTVYSNSLDTFFTPFVIKLAK